MKLATLRPRKSVQKKLQSISASQHISLEEVRNRIATKAYELYQQYGCRDGRDLDDWLEAERIVAKELSGQ